MAQIKLKNLVFHDVTDFKKSLTHAFIRFWKGKRIQISDSEGHQKIVSLKELVQLAKNIQMNERGKDYAEILSRLKGLNDLGHRKNKMIHKDLMRLFTTVNYPNLEKYKEEEEDVDEFEDIGSAIENKLYEGTLPIIPRNPFYDTDLVVFNDDYRGSIPLNGIRKSEFNAICNLYLKIVVGMSKFKIQGDADFKKIVLQAFKTLLTRDVGRQIIMKVNSMPEYPKIYIEKGKETEVKDSDDGNILITFNPMEKEEIVNLNYLPNGSIETMEFHPAFISLAHELLHLTHLKKLSENVEKAPTMGKQYHNLEEQVTITGLEEPLALFKYDRINESVLLSEFGFKHRTSHMAIKKPPLKIMLDTPTEEQSDYLGVIIMHGLNKDIDEFIRTNPNLSHIKSFDEDYPDLVTMAVTISLEEDNLDALNKFLAVKKVKKGEEFTFEKILFNYSAGKIALHLLGQKKEQKRIRKLSQDKKDFILRRALQKINIPPTDIQKKIVNKIIELGANPTEDERRLVA